MQPRLPLPPVVNHVPDHERLQAQAPPVEDYDVDLGLDFVQSVVALDPDLPYGTGASFGFSDLLGAHQVYAHISSATSQLKTGAQGRPSARGAQAAAMRSAANGKASNR